MQVDLKPSRKTIYYSVPMQLYMMYNIKNPALEAVKVLFGGKATVENRVKAFRQLGKANRAIDKLPEPTVKNTWHSNTRNLMQLREWLFEQTISGRLLRRFIRRPVKFGVIVYDFDPPWRWIIDNVREKALGMGWSRRGAVVRNLKELRDWLPEHCFLGDLRMGFIRRLFVFLIIACRLLPPCRWLIKDFVNEVLKMEWKERGYEDNYQYPWWRD